ncbi:MAG: hypothetical protein M3R70_00630 [Actinomycetota bacterium]|nr:hypothetical protein [Actinomycetota bacterium]
MDFQIAPEPEPAEREALETALERLLARGEAPGPYRSAWRDLGVRENVEDEEDDQAATRLRNNPGATRA